MGLVVDGGPSSSVASTVVDATADRWRVLAPVTERGEAIGLLELYLPTEPRADVVTEIGSVAHLLAFVVIALVAGFIANFLVAGKRKYENWELFVIGIVGSFVGGLIFSLIAGDGLELRPTGLIGSIIGAIVALLVYGPIRDQLRKRNVG